MVHRGVKPSNIIVLRSGVAKIGDFGIGRSARPRCATCPPSSCAATRSTIASDLFSLGAVFYEMLTRRAPFEGNSPEEITQNILQAEPPLPSKVNPHVPCALDAHRFPHARRASGRPVRRRPPPAARLAAPRGRARDGPGASAGINEPIATAPRETSLAPRAETKPAAPQPATEREPGLRTPEPNRFGERAPMQDAPRLAQHGQARDTSGLRFRRDPPAVEDFQHRGQIPGSEAFDQHDARFIVDRDARFMMDREREPERSSGSRVAKFAALALMVTVLAVGYIAFLSYSPGPSEPRTPVSHMKEAPAAAATPSPSTAPPPVAEASKEPATAPTAPEASPPRASGLQRAPATPAAPSRSTAPSPVAEATQEPATAPAAPAASPPRAMGDAGAEQESLPIASAPNPLPPKPIVAEPSAPAKAKSLPARESEQPATARTAPAQVLRTAQPTGISEAQPGGTAKLIIAVAPQGELYVNGKHYGTTPPITTLDIEPGMHRIEIRSGSRKPFLTYMTVEAGEQRRIRHDFAAKPIRPPT